jgi:hypothetical protein
MLVYLRNGKLKTPREGEKGGEGRGRRLWKTLAIPGDDKNVILRSCRYWSLHDNRNFSSSSLKGFARLTEPSFKSDKFSLDRILDRAILSQLAMSLVPRVNKRDRVGNAHDSLLCVASL